MKNESEGMGSMIPIKVALRCHFPKTGNASDTGESCPEKKPTPSEPNTFEKFEICLKCLRRRDVKPVLPGSVQLT